MSILPAGRRALILGLAALLVPMAAQSSDRQSTGRALLSAADRGDLDGVHKLLSERAPHDVRDSRGRSPLLLATIRNHVEIAQALIAAGADVNAKDAQQDSPYLYAAAEGRLEILRLTLAAGADLRSTNRYGGTALIPAAHHGHPDVVRELLKTKIDINHVNKLGWTALLEAVMLGDGGPTHIEIVRLLVDAGANVNLADRDGVRALKHARERHYREMARILEAAGAK